MTDPARDSTRRAWTLAYWFLTVAFLVTAVISMERIAAGFLSTYAADLTCPAWLYISIRGLTGSRKRGKLGLYFGASPERAAIVLFGGSTITELSQIWWPHGFFAGTYDPIDIVAYGSGVGVCYVFDKISGSRTHPIAD